MRFRLWLPLLQIASTALIVWAPWAPATHELDVLLPNGRELKTRVLITPTASELAQAINLPAATIVIPMEFALRRADALPNHNIIFYGYWLVGLLCWYMVGRLVDDLVAWRLTRSLPRKDPYDLMFALLALPSSILMAGVFTFGDAGSKVLAVWGIVWLVLSSTALLFRTWQYIKQRRRPRAA
jgi:hypothetical protein